MDCLEADHQGLAGVWGDPLSIIIIITGLVIIIRIVIDNRNFQGFSEDRAAGYNP